MLFCCSSLLNSHLCNENDDILLYKYQGNSSALLWLPSPIYLNYSKLNTGS